MLPLKLEKVVKAVKGTFIKGNKNIEVKGVSTDSRTISGGELFVPLKGEKFDGHDFIEDAFKKGAVSSLTEKPDTVKSAESLILVEDTLKALQDLAGFYRNLFRIPFVAVTGSTGKTTTKDMISAVLRQRFKVLSNIGNYNNLIGLPLTIFDLNKEHNVCVVEMGMNAFGEIKKMAKIVRPKYSIITNIGLSHIEKLGSVENILKAKMEILESMDEDDTVFLNADDSSLKSIIGQIKQNVVTYGIVNGDIKASKIRFEGSTATCFDVNISDKVYNFEIPVPGKHNVYNALAAIAVGIELGIDPEEIKKGLLLFRPQKMRLEFKKGLRNSIIINDAYNASPDSMRAAIDVLKNVQEGKRKIAVLGDMLEMGEWAPAAHKQVGRFIEENQIDFLFTVGELGKFIAKGALEKGMPEKRVIECDTNEEASKKLESIIEEYDIILIKGSRGMKMEQIVDYLVSRGKDK
ncbi:MAG: UDP-N-acetylmuramoyl-tripeptide--D-alanyl-D-alanine ligase [Thermosediminibacterales bacterium]|nr:UDP-N-acetylmuramoyl-tripeptide--D-alanyl-D-alanine ligase [Thermosediminibacterales bacterium]